MHKNFLCLLLIITTNTLVQHTHTDYRAAQGDRVIKAHLNGTIYFTTTHIPPKLHDTEHGNTQRNIARFTHAVDSWYSNNCQHNEVLNNLIDTVITYFKAHPAMLCAANGKQRIVIFDIDETTLSPYFFVKERLQKRIAQGLPDDEDMHPTPEQFTSLKPIKRLYDFFVQQKFKIVFITARYEKRTESTKLDLRHHGFTTYDALILMPWWYTLSGALYKELVRKSLAKTYDILLNVDDGYTNLQGEAVGLYAVWLPTPLERRFGEDKFLHELLQHAATA